MKLPFDDIIKAMVEAGTSVDDIAKTLARLMGESTDEAAKVVDEVVPPKSLSVVPKLVEEGKPLPAAEKISAASKKAKMPRIGFDEQIHAGEPTKFSDILSKEEYDALKDKELTSIRNKTVHAYNTSQLPRPRTEKKALNKLAHAETRTPEARRAAAAKRKEYFDNLKKGDK